MARARIAFAISSWLTPSIFPSGNCGSFRRLAPKSLKNGANEIRGLAKSADPTRQKVDKQSPPKTQGSQPQKARHFHKEKVSARTHSGGSQKQAQIHENKLQFRRPGTMKKLMLIALFSLAN
jgi:hypothetical protein